MGPGLTFFFRIVMTVFVYLLIMLPSWQVGRLEATCDEQEKKQYGYAIAVSVLVALAYFGFNIFTQYMQYRQNYSY